MHREEAIKYQRHIIALDVLIIIWPPAHEEYTARYKSQLILQLDRIAERQHTARPKTFILDRPPATPISPWNRKTFVMRHEASDGSCHFKRPAAGEQLTRREVDNIHRPELPWRWLIQEYILYLRIVGEWRVVLLNGKVHHTCATTPVDTPNGPDLITHCQVVKQWSLEEMR